ncbi:MAG: dehydrogenase [Candidatus Thermofonsia Clade 1 bacterium]|uniref:Dehydrogenase n=1 Tax=Candidatus Thermofonsia Clade 1 bacterium TaxID=2364210 RepID=A0A2M8NYW4_9CHLR|nr:MAG: dehydrogenase [Candidatus Thermofonsia Clade 1 bacterium]
MAQTMQGVFFLGAGQLELREVPIPQPAAGEVIVKVSAATTCGTDLKAYKRGHKLFKPPMPFGHEWAGTVVAVGEGVTGFKEGDRVTAANSAPCGACYYCRRGKPQLCLHLESRFNWGTYAEYLRVPAHIVSINMHKIPVHLSFVEAAFIEPLACAVLCINYADIALGDTVAIIGSGAQGLMQIQLAKAMGASQVIAIGRAHGRLEVARQLGADETISTLDTDAVAAVKALTEGRGADVVIEAAGSAETWQMAAQMARPAATVVLFSGLPGGTQVSFDATHLHYDEITLKGVFHHTPRTVEQALHMLISGQVNVKPMISGTIPLREVEEGLNRMARSEVIKLAVLPELH